MLLAPRRARIVDERALYRPRLSVTVATSYVTVILPPNLPADVAKDLGAPIPPASVTLVLENRDGDWKIVHTHFSQLASAN